MDLITKPFYNLLFPERWILQVWLNLWFQFISQEYSKTNQSYTLAAWNLDNLNLLIKNVNDLSQELIYLLKSQAKNGTVFQAITKAIAKTTAYDDPTFLDLYNLCSNLLLYVNKMNLNPNDIKALSNNLNQVKNSISKLIIAKTQSKDLKNSNGVSIYFPKDGQIDDTYFNLVWTKNNNSWLEFLKTYLAKSSFTD